MFKENLNRLAAKVPPNLIINTSIAMSELSNRLWNIGVKAAVVYGIARGTASCSPTPKPVETNNSNDTTTTETATTATALPLATSTETVRVSSMYVIIPESEIIKDLMGPYTQFTHDKAIQSIFQDTNTIEYSAAGVMVYDVSSGKPTAYTFFTATSEAEEMSKTVMVLGGDGGGVTYLPLNKVIDDKGNVTLAITQDMAGSELKKPVTIFDYRLTAEEISEMTAEELNKVDIFFTPSGLKIPADELLSSKVLSLVPPELPLPTEGKVGEIGKELEGTDYSLKWDMENPEKIVIEYTDPNDPENKSIIEGLYFDKDGNWKRTYEFETPYGTTAEVSTDSRVDEMTIVKGADGEPTVLDFSAWSVINGKWTREVKQGEILYDVAEAQFILQDNGSKKMSDGYGIMSESDYNGKSLLYNFLDAAFPGISHVNGNVVINDFRDVIDTGGYRWWGTDIKTLDASGQPLFIDTTNYVVHNLMSGNAILIYKNIDGKYQTIIINSNLNDLRNWSPYFKKAQI